ncbi:MAG: S9 family peptidase [Bryobacteraceae bacterium]
MRRAAIWLLFPALLVASAELDRSLKRIFDTTDFKVKTFGPVRWIENGAAYTAVEGTSLIKYETASGKRTVLVSAAQLTPPKAAAPLALEDYEWSEDSRRLLIFTEGQTVWRLKTRGDYWVLDLGTGKLQKLGGGAAPSTLMFAKFSPDGTRVAYVRENNIYCENLATGAIKRLTTDGSVTTINGTFDWVYEEEFKLRDGFRWSPDGRRIAFWQFDSTGIPNFALINNTDSKYPTLKYFPYPQVGGINSAARIGVVSADGGAARWISIPGDPRNHYIFRLTWTETPGELLIGQLNRLQNSMTLFLADAGSGKAKVMFHDEDKAWIDVRDTRPNLPILKSTWLKGGRELIWISERNGWKQVLGVAREGGSVRELTASGSDAIALEGLDEKGGWMYTIASGGNATQKYLYRTKLGRPESAERLSPREQAGTHAYEISPDCRWAFHTYSTFDQPPVTDLVSLPDHKVVRVLESNEAMRQAVAPIMRSQAEFFQVAIENGIVLDGYVLKPPGFDANKKYPVIVYVYGEPAAASVVDQWGNERGLFHRALANDGYLVVCFDNRGTPAPKGRDWRKSIYKSLGVLPPREQTEAMHAFAKSRTYVDENRIGVWGWSSGGINTLNLLFRSPETYRVGVAIAPLPDLTLYDTIYMERYMGLPEENPEAYQRASAIHFAEGLKGKLLLMHGSGDDNVHYQGTERLINRLIELDKPFEFMEYPNRSHAINEGKGTPLHLHRAIARYFEEHLPAGPR